MTAEPAVAVLYLITDLDIGGAERVLLETVRRLDRSRFHPSVCSLAPAGALADEFARLRVPVFDLGMRGFRHLAHASRALLHLLRRQQFDILHSHLFHANVLGRLAARRAGVPVVVSTIHVAEPRRWHLILERWTAPLATQLVAVSAGVRAHMVERAHLAAERILVIHNGVDVSPFSLVRGEFRRREGIPAGCTLITTVGRLDTQKGFPYLLKAAERVTLRHPDVRFLVVGEGPRRRDLVSLRDRLGLKERVRFLGFRTDVPQILTDSDLFVLPSLWEGFPIALLEAMAAGIAVVATDVPGVREVVADGETGLVVPRKDMGALAGALCRLLDDPDLRRRFARAGRRKVEGEFGWGKVVAATMSLYERLLWEATPRSAR